MRDVMHHISLDRFLTPREMAERDEPSLRYSAHLMYKRKFRDPDDLDSVVNAAIAFAVKQYRNDKGAKFRTYAQERIRTFVLDYHRANLGLRRQYHVGPSIAAAITGSVKYTGKRRHGLMTSLDALSGEHVFKAKDADPVNQFHGEDLSHYYRGLSERDSRIVEMMFQNDMTMQEIGNRLGLSESRISQVTRQILKHIRTRLEADAVKEVK